METFSALLAIYAGNSPVSAEIPTQRPVTRGFEVFFDLRLNKGFSKQSWGWWFETLGRQVVVVCDPNVICYAYKFVLLKVDSTGSCHENTFWCSKWLKRQNDSSVFNVKFLY